MGVISTVLGFSGFGFGFSAGIVIGYFLFIYIQPTDVKDVKVRPLVEYDSKSLEGILPEIPLWVKNPDYDRIDWLNRFLELMWPYLNTAICRTAQDIAKPIIAENTAKYKIDSVEFETLTLGSLPPTFQGMKVYVTEEQELIMEPSLKWAANPNITVVVKAYGLKATIQIVDLQVFASPRITLKPLVPTFPCFAKILVSLMEKPHVDFGLKLLGADVMAIPGLYRFVQEAVAAAWMSVPTGSCPYLTLSQKFKATAKGLQRWSSKKVGNVKFQLALTREILHQFEIAQDNRSLSPGELWLKNNLKKHSLALASLSRTIDRLRSRIGWLREGDANTKLFHLHARHRKRKNFIGRLISGDRICTSHQDKAEVINNFYENLLGSCTDRLQTVNLDEIGIDTHDLADLDLPFSEEEVWKTILQLPSDKAPGPDGFTGRFYKSCWPIIKEDIMAAVSALWSRKFMNFGTLNSAYITLLPKKDGADQPKDFRPISLVHSFAKLITKLLASRLAGRLQQMVSPNQSAFIKGRFIQDNFMLVQQTARYLHQQKQPRILLKLDISKAFDSVSWPFLLEVLQHLGFGQIWRDIICGLLSSSTTQVLLNGVPGECISHRRGLRQGDPLSPMLFILVMDVLGHLIAQAASEGLLQPLSARNLQHRISLYADDVVFFLRPDVSDISVTMDILQIFGEASGLKTNLQKSSVLPIRCGDLDLTITQNLLPCALAEFPCKYLGLPLSLKKLNKSQVQPIVDRIADQLPGWKAELMTRAGRKIQVQFVLTGMLIYIVMATDLPAWAIKAIDKIRRDFLWRGRKEARGGHCLVAWVKVCRPTGLGGLGISDLKTLGWALRMRWLWLQKTEPNRPWAHLPIHVPDQVKAFFAVAVISEVGDGEHTLFWADRWLHGQSISELAPRLFAVISKRRIKQRTVKEALNNRAWITDIQGAITVGVMVDVLQLWDILSDVVLQPEREDKHIWRFSSSGQYSAKAAYEGFFLGATLFAPWERIWKTWAPPKCRFFMWLVAHNKCWTSDRLARRGLPCPDGCPLCDQEQETINHLLVQCVFAREFWFILLRQETIKKQVASMYLWPKTLEVPIMDPSKASKRPVGILLVKVVRAQNLRKKDLLGKSDPYVKLKMSDDKLPSKKTTVKRSNLNPEWNEEFKFVVTDPENQALEVNVFDWEQVGKHEKMGMNMIPLRELPPEETKVTTLSLLKTMDPNDVQNEKSRGELTLELTYKPFKEEDMEKEDTEGADVIEKAPDGTPADGGLLYVIVHEAQDLEGKHHTNPYAKIIFKGEEKKTKVIKKNRDPRWEDEFEFVCEEPPVNDKLHVEVLSKAGKKGLIHGKETLGYIDISLADVISNKRINEKYHLIDSKNGQIQIELQWRTS